MVPSDPAYQFSITNEPLTAGQEQYVKDEVASLDATLTELDLEIRGLCARFQLLRTQRMDIVKRKASYTKILSPWRALPCEILTEILRMAVFAGTEGSTSEKGTSLGERFPITAQLSTLACVCKRWAQVIYGTPSLWCEVEIMERKRGMGLYEMVHNLQKHYARCGSMPWSLSFSSDRLLHPDNPGFPYPGTTALPLVNFLKNSTRWKSLSISHQVLDILAPLFSNEPGVLDYSWPELESLYLKGWYYGPAKIEPFVNTQGPVYMGSMPRLTSLTLLTHDQRISNWQFPWRQLTTLRLTTADSYSSYMQILKMSPNLQFCDLSLPPSANPTSTPTELEWITSADITLPHLKVLQVKHSTSIWPFFTGVTFPSLQRLTVSTPPATHGRTKDVPAGKALSDFLTRSKCSLTSLALNSIPLHDDDYISILKQTPEVCSLQITDYANAGFWFDSVNKDELVPKVKEVLFHGHFERGTFVRKFLDQFLEERGGLEHDDEGPYYADEVNFSEEIFHWNFCGAHTD